MTQFTFNFNNEWLDQYFDLIDSYDDKNIEKGEKHHIWPTCIFGKNDITVKLTVLDHFKAHWFLYKAFKLEYDNRTDSVLSEQFRKICYGLSSFNQINDERRKKLSLLSIDEIDSYGLLIAEARIANTEAWLGELNPSKRPEVKEKISKALTGKKRTPEQCEQISKRLCEFYQTDAGKAFIRKLSENKLGVPLKEEHRLAVIAALTTPEHRQKMSNIMLEKHKDLEWYNSVFTTEYREEISKRFKGIPKTQDHRDKIAAAHIGKEHPWQNKINKNPEKIRKTAEKHRGMKRSAETKAKQSARRLATIKKHGGAFNKNQKLYYDPSNPKDNHIQCLPENKPEGWVSGHWKTIESQIGTACRNTKQINIFIQPYNNNFCYVKNEKGAKQRFIKFGSLEDVILGLEKHGYTTHIEN
jgi:hypothetical protein